MNIQASKSAPARNHKKKKPVRSKRVYPNKTKRVHQWDNEKESARLASLTKTFSGGRLFNGYVREALPMVIFVVIVIIVMIGLSILFLQNALTMKLPADLETKTVQVSEIREDEDSIFFDTDAGTLYTSKKSVHPYEQMLESFSPGDTFAVTCSREDPEAMWGIRARNGKEYLSPDGLLKDLKNNRLLGFWICAAILIVLILFCIAANHILSNAPNYPHLARLFVRKQYLNIDYDTIADTQMTDPSPPAANPLLPNGKPMKHPKQ